MAQENEKLTPTDRKYLKNLFRLYDEDGSGAMDLTELKNALTSQLGCAISDDNVKLMMTRVHSDESQDLDFEDFCLLMGLAFFLKKQVCIFILFYFFI